MADNILSAEKHDRPPATVAFLHARAGLDQRTRPMSEAITATYDARGFDIPAAGTATPPGVFPRKRRARRAPTVDRSAPPPAGRPLPGPSADRQVREEPDDYLSRLVSGKADNTDWERSMAAHEHTKPLVKAMRNLDEARNLLAVLIATLDAIGDRHAMQAETVLTIVEKKLDKAHTRIDRQATRDRKFFLAHFELEGDGETREGED